MDTSSHEDVLKDALGERSRLKNDDSDQDHVEGDEEGDINDLTRPSEWKPESDVILVFETRRIFALKWLLTRHH